jgi:hypothetical protein
MRLSIYGMSARSPVISNTCPTGVAEPRDELISESQSETIEDLLDHPVSQQRQDVISRKPDGRKTSDDQNSHKI